MTIRWGILSTARIAASAFLPGLQAAGGGEALLVGSRDEGRAAQFAEANGVAESVPSYERVIDDPRIDAVYIPLPNRLHGEWTIRALQAGKAVLCEKPLCASVDETRAVIAAASRSARPLWEAFVFPFHDQFARVLALVQEGAIGPLREIQSEFHFRLTRSTDIRRDPVLGGGSLYDVGCYPVRFAQLIFRATPVGAVAVARWSADGVDEELHGVVSYPEYRYLHLSCGMLRNTGTAARIVGDEGEIRVSNPFHGREHDIIEIRRGAGVEVERRGSREPTFASALRHVHAVLRGEEAPRHTAPEDSQATEEVIDLLYRAAARRLD